MDSTLPTQTNMTSIGQWAIARLQAEAKEQLALFFHDDTGDETKEKLPFIGPMRDPQVVESKEPEPEPEPVTLDRPQLSVGRYRGAYGKLHGTLCLDLNQMHFEEQITNKTKWSLRYNELKSLRKVSMTPLLM